jgi:hypothetical protein
LALVEAETFLILCRLVRARLRRGRTIACLGPCSRKHLTSRAGLVIPRPSTSADRVVADARAGVFAVGASSIGRHRHLRRLQSASLGSATGFVRFALAGKHLRE